MSFIVYLPNENYLNEATSYYIDVIRKGMQGKDLGISFKLSDVRSADRVIVIDAKSLFLVKAYAPWQPVITWYQGVVPEETMLISKNRWKKCAWEIFERISLHFSSLNVFVSSAMLEHYKRKYKTNITNFFIMPCFNKKLNIDLMKTNDSKYKNLSFVYAGGLHTWQCFEKMLLVFKHIKQLQNEATMTVLTFNKKEAIEIINDLGLSDFDIKVNTVPLNDIDFALSSYHYGFILRENNIVNNVATPTKMNSYLSVGVLPIYTDAVFDFVEKLSELKGAICLKSDLSPEEMASTILDFHFDNGFLNPLEIQNSITHIFDDYYNEKKYIQHLKNIDV